MIRFHIIKKINFLRLPSANLDNTYLGHSNFFLHWYPWNVRYAKLFCMSYWRKLQKVISHKIRGFLKVLYWNIRFFISWVLVRLDNFVKYLTVCFIKRYRKIIKYTWRMEYLLCLKLSQLNLKRVLFIFFVKAWLVINNKTICFIL